MWVFYLHYVFLNAVFDDFFLKILEFIIQWQSIYVPKVYTFSINKHKFVFFILFLYLCPGFESASLHNKKARERPPRNTFPRPHNVWELSALSTPFLFAFSILGVEVVVIF
jgi:hypothetical protein